MIYIAKNKKKQLVQGAQKGTKDNLYFAEKRKTAKKRIEKPENIGYNGSVYKSAFGYGVFMRIKRGWQC